MQAKWIKLDLAGHSFATDDGLFVEDVPLLMQE